MENPASPHHEPPMTLWLTLICDHKEEQTSYAGMRRMGLPENKYNGGNRYQGAQHLTNVQIKHTDRDKYTNNITRRGRLLRVHR